MTDKTSTTVRILDKDYQFACSPDERTALMESARYLDAKMKEIRATGRTIGMDRIAVMAALNIAHDLLNQQGMSEASEQEIVSRVRDMRERVQTVLGSSLQLEL